MFVPIFVKNLANTYQLNSEPWNPLPIFTVTEQLKI